MFCPLPTHPFALGPAPFEDDDLLSPFFGPAPAMPRYASCGRSACAAPAPAFRFAPSPTVYRVVRQPAFAPPAEPEVLLRRTGEGVLAACPLGHAFRSRDIRCMPLPLHVRWLPPPAGACWRMLGCSAPLLPR